MSKWSEIFRYESGNLYWKIKPSKKVAIGTLAGSLNSGGYMDVQLKRKHYQVHRIIYEMFYGPIPYGMEIDHKDHIRTNNIISNLRLVTHPVNQKNQRKNSQNTSGIVGVTWKADRNKWHAQISVAGKNKHLGFFDDIADARKARQNANIQYDYHKNHGM